jgi:uncharacterized protein YndB with AHSA1/START domain
MDDATVVRELVIPAERDEVWRALVDPDLLREWLAPDAELDVREGGEVAVDGGARRGVVERVEEGERLVWRWRSEEHADDPVRGVETTVEITLADVEGGVQVQVVESGLAAVGPTARAGVRAVVGWAWESWLALFAAALARVRA